MVATQEKKQLICAVCRRAMEVTPLDSASPLTLFCDHEQMGAERAYDATIYPADAGAG